MESVTKHDTSSLKLQGQRSPLHAIQLGCSRGWQQLTGPGSSMKNMQSGAPSCLIDMLIARSVFKHTCSFTRRKHSRRNYVTTHRKPVIKLQSVHFFFLARGDEWLKLMPTNLCSRLRDTQQVQSSECRGRYTATTQRMSNTK